MQEFELVVVGAGLAGTTAALVARRAGLEVVLIDEQPFDGGAYRRNVPYWFGSRAAARSPRQVDLYGWIERHARLQAVLAENVDLRLRTAIWGVFPHAPGWIVGVFDGIGTQALARARDRPGHRGDGPPSVVSRLDAGRRVRRTRRDFTAREQRIPGGTSAAGAGVE